MTDQFDIAIIGAGPSGLAAAGVAGQLGIKTTVIDEQEGPGGQVYRAITKSETELTKKLGSEYAAGREFLPVLEYPSVSWMWRTCVWEISQDGTIYFSNSNGSGHLSARHVILATGTQERPMPFPGWTLPGVMTAGGLQILLKSAGLIPQGDVVLAGSGPLLYLLARQLHDFGVTISALVETTPWRNYIQAAKYFPAILGAPYLLQQGIGLLKDMRKYGIRHYRHASDLSATGTDNVATIKFKSANRLHELKCNVLAIHNGVIPNVQMTRQLQLKHHWHHDTRCWYPSVGIHGETQMEWLRLVGDGGGIYGANAATYQGTIAAWSIARLLGTIDSTIAEKEIDNIQKKLIPIKSARRFIDCLYAPAQEFLTPAGDTIVCRCEEVTAKDVFDFVDLGCTGPNQTKAFGRPGMGPCQGRFCGLTVCELIASRRKVPIADVGYFRIRSPIKPVTLAQLATLDNENLSGS